ncbi:MAG: DUF1638 domain-containing protein [Limnochordia bacterium]|jgi:hypothetical protein|nr:DUF1638 domain-containing protein [Limnochordia bacterium]
MRLKVVACEVLMREICHCIARSPHTVDVEFTKKDGHDQVEVLRGQIQAKIDTAAKGDYDAILLGYGLCGNGTVGLVAKHTPLVIPRAHDCCTLFLGSRLKFEERFAQNPSQPFSSLGYMERGNGAIHSSSLKKTLGLNRTYEDYAAQYGQDNALYIMETLFPSFQLENHEEQVLFITIPETTPAGTVRRFREQAESDGKPFTEVTGDIGLMERLLSGEWDDQEFLVVPPGHSIEGVYDWQEICRATTCEKNLAVKRGDD